jgi:hypothetical protein
MRGGWPESVSLQEALMRTIPFVAMTFVLYRYPVSEHALTALGVPNTVVAMAELTAVSIRMSNVKSARSGNGGFCSRNPFAANGATREPQRRLRRNY